MCLSANFSCCKEKLYEAYVFFKPKTYFCVENEAVVAKTLNIAQRALRYFGMDRYASTIKKRALKDIIPFTVRSKGVSEKDRKPLEDFLNKNIESLKIGPYQFCDSFLIGEEVLKVNEEKEVIIQHSIRSRKIVHYTQSPYGDRDEIYMRRDDHVPLFPHDNQKLGIEDRIDLFWEAAPVPKNYKKSDIITIQRIANNFIFSMTSIHIGGTLGGPKNEDIEAKKARKNWQKKWNEWEQQHIRLIASSIARDVRQDSPNIYYFSEQQLSEERVRLLGLKSEQEVFVGLPGIPPEGFSYLYEFDNLSSDNLENRDFSLAFYLGPNASTGFNKTKSANSSV